MLMMSNNEICTSYRDAGETAKQIQILSELNACKVSVICGILLANGHELPRKRGGWAVIMPDGRHINHYTPQGNIPEQQAEAEEKPQEPEKVALSEEETALIAEALEDALKTNEAQISAADASIKWLEDQLEQKRKARSELQERGNAYQALLKKMSYEKSDISADAPEA